MNKMKKPCTRKQRALLRLVILLPLLALLVLSRRYGFTPEHALREVEEMTGTGPTQVIRELGSLPVGTKERKMALAANDNAVLLFARQFGLGNGWESGGYSVLDCSTDERIHTASWQLSCRNGEEKTVAVYFFGRVDDPEIEELSIRLVWPEAGSEGRTDWNKTLGREDWFTWNGHTYFLASHSFPGRWNEDYGIGMTLQARDGAGIWTEVGFQHWTASYLN